MYVVATAGHVDHGKSTLVRALTGMEPDRWAQERQRGLTIDLGFAWMRLPAGQALAFVDVPGHRRFIGNMLAGLGPAPAVLFVVAADDGWAAQSQEHLRAVQALGLRQVVLAVTRTDLTDPGPALEQAGSELHDAGLRDVPAVPVSGITGAGLPQLVEALETVAARIPVPDPQARLRLWVDRAFSVAGSGTVVTGTLAAGTLTVGEELELLGPRGSRLVSVRAIQSLGQACDGVAAVARVAINVRRLPAAAVGRGDALLAPRGWHRSAAVDVRLPDGVDGRLPQWLTLHVGTAAVPVRVRRLAAGTARLRLDRPLPLQPGDRGILREPGGRGVLAGIVVLDAEPPLLRRRGEAARWGAELADLPAGPDLASAVRRRGWLSAASAIRLGVVDSRMPEAAVQGVLRLDEWYVDEATWARWCDRLPRVLADYQVDHPLAPRMPQEQARALLELPDLRLLTSLAAACRLQLTDGRIGQAGAGPDLRAVEAGLVDLELALDQHPFAAPERPELQAAGLGRPELAAAVRAGRLLALDDQVVLLPTAPAKAMRVLAALPQPFTTSQARQALDTTRRVVIPLLEHLDQRGWTRRLDAGHRQVVRPN